MEMNEKKNKLKSKQMEEEEEEVKNRLNNIHFDSNNDEHNGNMRYVHVVRSHYHVTQCFVCVCMCALKIHS